MTLRLGSLVEYVNSPGIGRVARIDGDRIRVEHFESVAEPVADAALLPLAECRPARLERQTRVFRLNGQTGEWTPGRIAGGQSPRYFVRFPNSDVDLPIDEAELRVRWDRPIRNPVDVLASTANETPVLRDARIPLLRDLVRQRAACAGMTAVLSAAVEIYPHQLHTVMKVLQDPVQRYLLADEVGLGKTIEAGLIVRQTMLDRPDTRIAVIAPDLLRRQWQRELREKFFIDDFPRATLRIGAHEMPAKWSDYHGFDLVVIDEAHRIVQGGDPGTSPYRDLAALAHSVPRILLLSATPATAHPDTHLGLLHLLAPSIYRWDDRAAFARRLKTRQQLADALFALDGEFTFLLEPTLQQIGEIVPDDPLLKARTADILGLLDEDGELADADTRGGLNDAIAALRAHVGETYRLHRRMIRHRRSAALTSSDESNHYEIRGRSRAQSIPVRSREHDAAQEVLLDWQGGIADVLLDEGRTDERPAYGKILAVLAARAGGPVDDLVAALSWRIQHDAEAADRAGLTATERAELRAPAVAAVEHQALAALVDARGDGPTELAASLVPLLRRSQRAVVFCGPGGLARSLARELHRHLPVDRRVREHTAEVGGAAAEQAVQDWTTGRGVLVLDGTGEDGLNLQIADVVVHCRLPRSPNVLEQRLGRVDRYVSVRPGAPTGPAVQFVLAQADGLSTISGAWVELLGDGYRIFDSSLSSLQDAVEVGLDDVWAAGLERGPAGLTVQAQAVADRLDGERKAVEAADLIESVFGTTAEADATTAAVDALEVDWRTVESTVVTYADDGLRLARTEVDGTRVVRFRLGGHEPLMPPRLLARGGHVVTADALREGAFNRSVALRMPSTRVFRIGHPFVDLLATVMEVDDRGQAAAFWRIDRTHTGDPEVYFAVDFLVEASFRSAAELVDQAHPGALHALRRQADGLFPPFVGRAWVRAGAGTAVSDQHSIDWLDQPFDRSRNDLNLNPTRIPALINLFGTRERFAQAARDSDGIARRDLVRVTDLAERSAAAAERGRGQIEVLRAQALARRAAGDLVGDADAYTLDVELTEAFLTDLGTPTIRPVGATCIVRSGPSGMPRAEN
ncbi:hypothetical protein K1T35_11440 [Pseudonocardia sp. DSM 110487]|uniref:protein DpdE n=1 Tax=Pseudonocardia sp. DSM 110487 TaxID=2865833 RepID=UPI001C6A7C15|nr:protein DpdE [Pseudonocardia sp. DSM 110487]QYN37793.1 hypothetical protein K1T35_11440 [Pseudonocardia sp. DSM 110487]